MTAGGAAFKDLDDIIELGFEGFDLIADKGLDRMPCEALHRDYYHPRRLRNSLASRSGKSSSAGKTEPERQTTRTRTRSPSPTSRIRMRSRDRYDEDYRGGFERATAPAAAGPLVMYTPRDEQEDNIQDKDLQVYQREQPDWITSSTESLPGSVVAYSREAPTPAPPSRYPRPLPLRRTSSLDDCADRASRRYSGRASSPSSSVAATRRRRDSDGKRMDKRPAHQQFFSQTSKGLAGGAIGAVVGGLVARQAVGLLGARAPGEEGIDSNGGRLAKQSEKLGLQGEDRAGKRVKDPHWAVTLLGAAVAGLGVNALVEKKEESEREKKAAAAMTSRRDSRAKSSTRSAGAPLTSSSRSSRSDMRDDRDRDRYRPDWEAFPPSSRFDANRRSRHLSVYDETWQTYDDANLRRREREHVADDGMPAVRRKSMGDALRWDEVEVHVDTDADMEMERGSGLEAARARAQRMGRARWARSDVDSRDSTDLADDEFVYYDVRRVERY